MLGTDYPFDMAETDPNGLIDRVEGLTDDERQAIRGGTAARLFGI
jgi:aminocarboxymuconate-semialdehyde decarboxylase